MIHVASSLAADEARIATLPQLWRSRCAQWSDRPALRHKECGIWQGPRWGDYFAEAKMLNVAHQYQLATDWHTRVPPGCES